MWIIVTGNPVDGLTFVGPFEGHDDALAHAEDHVNDDNWWIAVLEPVEEPVQ